MTRSIWTSLATTTTAVALALLVGCASEPTTTTTTDTTVDTDYMGGRQMPGTSSDRYMDKSTTPSGTETGTDNSASSTTGTGNTGHPGDDANSDQLLPRNAQ